MSITIFVIISIFPYGLRERNRAEINTITTNLAQAKIEQLLSQTYSQISVGTTTEPTLAIIDNDFADYNRITSVNYVNEDLAPASSETGLKRIKVLISWYDPQRNTTTTLSLFTLKAKQ